MRVLIAGYREVEQLLPMAACIEAVAGALRALAAGQVVLPLRQVVMAPGGQGALAVMPSYLGDPAAYGSKVITVFPGNSGTRYDSHQGAVLLFETEHGALLAMADAGAITAIRTAAASGVATRALAREEARDLAILGSGTQARTHLDAMCAVRPIKRVRVWSRTPEHAQAFARREAVRHGLEITAVPSVPAAVEGADLICTTTAARQPILAGAWLQPGTHINAAGGGIRGYRELDTEAVARSRLVADRVESALHEADEVILPLEAGEIGPEHLLGELGEVLLGRIEGRTSPDDITVFESLGIAVEDVAAVHHVYEAARSQGVGTWLEFSAPRQV